ncbi:MAG: hypothetical protein K2K93_00945, partial [Muribaculaceae bacterium]|nr:hypothetical protein [Muribaculaceae bacterium]
MYSASKPAASTIPDFAYPKKVAEVAGKNLDSSIAAGKWPEAVKALVEKVTAENLVSASDQAGHLAEIDSVCEIAPDRWKPAFLLLKGNLLARIYESNRRRADGRTLPIDSVPENPLEWSKDIFASKIAGICTSVLADNLNAGRPLKEWEAFLKDTAFAMECNMTVDEFEAAQCSSMAALFATDEMTDVIPFFKNDTPPATPVARCGELRKQADARLSELASKSDQNLLLAYSLMHAVEALPYSMQMPAAIDAYKKVKGTEGEQIILIDLRRYIPTSIEETTYNALPLMTMEEYVDAMRKSIAAFPKGRYSNGVRNTLNDLTEPSARVSYNQQYLTTDTIKMRATLSNCNESWILIYDYSRYADTVNPPKSSVVANNCPLVKPVKISADGTVPFSKTVNAEVGALRAGTYVAIPSASPNKAGIYANEARNSWREPFTVSDISVLTLQCPDNSTKVFVVSAVNGKPIKG